MIKWQKNGGMRIRKLIPFSFSLLVCLNWSVRIQIGMEWKLWNDNRMSALPKIKKKFLYKNYSHSPLFYHFWSFKNITEWNSQCKNYHSWLFTWFLLIPSPYISLKCSKNGWMRVEWGIFLKQGKTLNSQISSILLSFCHLYHIHWFILTIPFILISFLLFASLNS